MSDKDMRDADAIDQETLAAWKAEEPPADFATRVLAARAAEASASDDAPSLRQGDFPDRPRRIPPRRPAHLAYALIGLAVAAVAALAVGLATWRAAGSGSHGARLVGARASIPIGARAVAVAEAGSDLAWTLGDKRARVTQRAGDVFYRVDRGGSFVVETPAGTVTVQGTCFRVEVFPMRPSKSALFTVVTSAVVGATLTAAVFVTVYEGRVLLANEKGETRLVAGEKGSMSPGAPPNQIALEIDPQAIAAATDPAPLGSATREELLERDKVQREELAKLRVKVRELEGLIQAGGPGGGRDKQGDFPFVDTTQDQLVAMAKECRVQWDSPPMDDMDPEMIGPDRAKRMQITEEERLALNKAFLAATEKIVGQLRALYIEVTGDAAGAETLSAHALQQEIENKSAKKDMEEAMWRISQERAGLLPPPADLAGRPAVERMLRLLVTVGDLYEKSMAQILGPERAHALRKKNDGWGAKHAWAGCPDDKKPPGADDQE